MSTHTRLRGGALLGVLVLAGGLALPTAAFGAQAPNVNEEPVRLEVGHVDAFSLVLNEDDSARLLLKEDVTGSQVLRTPESVELFVKSQARSTNLPAAALPPGAPTELYHLPLTQDPQLLWPGWDSQSLSAVYGAQADVDIDITSVDGPGEVYLWTNGLWGALAPLLTDGYKLPGTIHQNYLAHVHANWGFTAPGSYQLTARATVTSADGTKSSTSNEATYTFVVAPAPTAVNITGAEGSVAPGSEVTLSAAQVPADATFTNYTWSTRASGSGAWETVAGANGSTLTINAVDGAQYRAAVSGGKDYASGNAAPIVVESAPVTITAQATPVEQAIAIAPLAHHYHSNSPIDLAVIAEPAVESGSYRWYVQRSDQDEPRLIEGATAATHRVTAEQALNGAKVTAELLSENGAVVATAAAVTIEVDDHGAAPLQKVTVGGVAHHYHTGDAVRLSAAVAPASVLDRFEWYVQKEGETAPVLIEGENGAEYSFTATEELAGAAVIAKLTYDDGRPYAESLPVIVRLDNHGEVPATDLTIATNRDADDYWVGQTATLTARQSTPTGLTEYQWLVKLPGANAFTVVDGQTAADYKFKPTLANSGVEVKAQLLHDGEVHAESAPVTITAQQRDIVTTLGVTADKESYAPGETAHLVSTQNPQTGHDHYHWYVKRAGASDYVWVDQSRDKDLDYPVTAEDTGAQLVLRMFDDTHAVIAESAPHTLSVDAGGTDPDPVTALTIDGLASGYYAGETATLTAVQTPATGEEHYHWFIKRSGDADYSVISGAATATLRHEVAATDAGAQLVAKLYNHDHQVIAESSPITLTVLPGSPKPGEAPQPQTNSALDGVDEGGIAASTTTPAQGQVITVKLGDGAQYAGEWVAAWLLSDPILLGNDWIQVAADGTIAVTIPADVSPSAHRLAVFDAAGNPIGWQQLQVQAAPVTSGAGASGSGLPATGGELPIGLAAGAVLLLLLGAGTMVAVKRRHSSAHLSE